MKIELNDWLDYRDLAHDLMKKIYKKEDIENVLDNVELSKNDCDLIYEIAKKYLPTWLNQWERAS